MGSRKLIPRLVPHTRRGVGIGSKLVDALICTNRGTRRVRPEQGAVVVGGAGDSIDIRGNAVGTITNAGGSNRQDQAHAKWTALPEGLGETGSKHERYPFYVMLERKKPKAVLGGLWEREVTDP